MSEELGLTEVQKEQLRQSGKEQAEARRAIREDESLTAEQKREKLRQLNQERQAKMREVLTPEQQEKFRELRQQQRERRRSRRGDGGPGGGGRMAEELGLSDEQREQFRAMNEQQREQFEAIRNDESLSQEDRRAQMRELREARQARIEGDFDSRAAGEVREDASGTKGKARGASRRASRRPRRPSWRRVEVSAARVVRSSSYLKHEGIFSARGKRVFPLRHLLPCSRNLSVREFRKQRGSRFTSLLSIPRHRCLPVGWSVNYFFG